MQETVSLGQDKNEAQEEQVQTETGKEEARHSFGMAMDGPSPAKAWVNEPGMHVHSRGQTQRLEEPIAVGGEASVIHRYPPCLWLIEEGDEGAEDSSGTNTQAENCSARTNSLHWLRDEQEHENEVRGRVAQVQERFHWLRSAPVMNLCVAPFLASLCAHVNAGTIKNRVLLASSQSQEGGKEGGKEGKRGVVCVCVCAFGWWWWGGVGGGG